MLPCTKAYRAESKVFKKEKKLSEEKVKLFFEEVVGSKWFKKKYGEGYLIYFVSDNLSQGSFALYKEIYLIKSHFTQSSVLHELAHAVKRPRKNHHGKAWQKRYVEMVKIFIDKKLGSMLELEFNKI